MPATHYDPSDENALLSQTFHRGFLYHRVTLHQHQLDISPPGWSIVSSGAATLDLVIESSLK